MKLRGERKEESSSEDVFSLRALSAEVDDKIHRLDLLIKKYSSMLERIQPFAPGKIGIRFIALRGGGSRQFVFVVWKYTATTRATRELKFYDIVPANGILKRVKRYGPFLGTESDVRYLLAGVRVLIERRHHLVTTIGRARQAIRVSLNATERAHDEHLASYRVEYPGLVDRHEFRFAEWRHEQEEKARHEAELDAMGAVPDPADYIEMFHLPPEEDDTPGALPVDEHGNYFEP